MMTELQDHKQAFIKTAYHIISTMKELFGAWKKHGWSSEKARPLFRGMHSLKSGAAFYGLGKMEETAHQMESVFSCYSDEAPDDGIEKDIEEQFNNTLDIILQELQRIEENPSSDDFSSLNPERHSGRQLSRKLGFQFNDFEQLLIEEAFQRGEQLYRISCYIDEEETMPLARAFLLISNLETRFNVIKTDPPFDREDADFSVISFFIGTREPESNLYSAVNVDRVDRVHLIRIDYSKLTETVNDSFFVSSGPEGMRRGKDSRYLSVDREKLDEIRNYLESLKSQADSFILSEKEREALNEKLSGINSSLDKIELIPFAHFLNGFPSYIEETALASGLEISCELEGMDTLWEHRLLGILSEALLQFVRNSIRHGIENPENRLASGKERKGKIRIRVRGGGDGIKLIYDDDGRGIDEEAVRALAEQKGFVRPGDQVPLLSLIGKPGFSTTQKADFLAGRGIGLDLAIHRIQSVLGGNLELINKSGEGLRYNISLPGSRSLLRFLFIQREGFIFALPRRHCEKKMTLNKDKLGRDENRCLLYPYKGEMIPVYNYNGAVSLNRTELEAPYLLVIRYLGKKAALLADEMVMEKEMVSEEFQLLDQMEPFLYRFSIKGIKQKYIYLSPALVG